MWSKIPSSKTALGSALIGGHAVQSCPLGLRLILWCRLKNSPLHPCVTQTVPWCRLFLWLQAALVQSTPSSHGSSPGLHKVGTVSAWESHCSCSGQVLCGMATLQQICGFNHFILYHGPVSVSLTSLALFHPFDQRQCLMCYLTLGFLPIP